MSGVIVTRSEPTTSVNVLTTFCAVAWPADNVNGLPVTGKVTDISASGETSMSICIGWSVSLMTKTVLAVAVEMSAISVMTAACGSVKISFAFTMACVGNRVTTSGVGNVLLKTAPRPPLLFSCGAGACKKKEKREG